MISIRTVGATQIELKLARRIAALEDLRPVLEAATAIVYEATRQRFDSGGDGDWEQLAESTVARKASQGSAEPERILYEEGNLYESATSPSGPYSVLTYPTPHSAVIGIDWERDGYQIPQILDQGAGEGGAFPTGAHGERWHIPPRKIWPDAVTLIEPVGDVILEEIALV